MLSLGLPPSRQPPPWRRTRGGEVEGVQGAKTRERACRVRFLLWSHPHRNPKAQGRQSWQMGRAGVLRASHTPGQRPLPGSSSPCLEFNNPGTRSFSFSFILSPHPHLCVSASFSHCDCGQSGSLTFHPHPAGRPRRSPGSG